MSHYRKTLTRSRKRRRLARNAAYAAVREMRAGSVVIMPQESPAAWDRVLIGGKPLPGVLRLEPGRLRLYICAADSSPTTRVRS